MIKSATIFSIISLVSFGAQAALVSVEPDDFAAGTIINTAYTGVTLSVTDPLAVTAPPRDVISINGEYLVDGTNLASTGSLVFGFDPPLPGWDPIIGSFVSGQYLSEYEYGLLRFDFDIPTNFVQIDLIFDDQDIGELRAYDSSGVLLDTAHVEGEGIVTTVDITRLSSDIAYIEVGGVTDHGILLDNMYFDYSPVPVPAAIWLFGSGLIGLIGIARQRKA